MSSTDRQNRLLLAEDWQTIYRSFKYADFKSYDFDNLRRTMINYIRQNYPEDFNDYIESSEYLSLIDLVAFLGQNISFRTDLNARENFIELAERRESVLRLARLISYNVTRNQSGNGLLKITSVSTTESVTDTNGTNLSGRTVKWNDTLNDNWYEQFIKIMNSALVAQNNFGTPTKRDIIDGIPTEKYSLNNTTSVFPVFSFQKNVNGNTVDFELVSTDIDNGAIVEEAPGVAKNVNFLYRDNGQGAASSNVGFFFHFRQGTLQRGDFTVDLPTPNQTIDIDTENVNNTDVWLYEVDNTGVETNQWTKVDAVEGNNIIYNSLNKNIKNIFSVLTRTNDRISLIFSDGVFGTLPKGNFRAYYRQSLNLDYTIVPSNIRDVKVSIPYTSGIGRTETLTLFLSLQQTVDNGTSTETTQSIKTNAPSTYYTQNRLITGEDYNIGPLGISQDIIKTKAVNRTSSGINRYYDLRDATGKYSTTNLLGVDGVVYKDYETEKNTFNFVTRSDIESVVNNLVTSIVDDKNIRNYYYDKFTEQDYTELELSWQQKTADTNRSTGFIVDTDNVSDTNAVRYSVSSFTEGVLRYIEPGAMVKFLAPAGQHFMPDGTLMVGDADHDGSYTYKWTKVVSVSDGGTEETASGLGGIVFNDIIPTGAILKLAKPKFVRDILDSVKTIIIDEVFAFNTFGLRYDVESRSWLVITAENLNTVSNFSLSLAGDVSGNNLDSSWLLLFETNGVDYTITSRTLRYVFESDKEVRFFFDGNKKIYDSKTGEIIRDKISVLSVNKNLASAGGLTPFTVDYDWEVSSEFRDGIGYVNSKKVEVVFFDSDDDGVVDNPQIFEDIVVPDTNVSTKYIFVKKQTDDNEFYVYVDQTAEGILVVNDDSQAVVTTPNNPIYYVIDKDIFYQIDSTARTRKLIFNYKAYIGRAGLKFQYIHASDEHARIDPSSSNIIDTYILTKQYDTLFRQYLTGVTTILPLPMSSDQMSRSYGSELNKIKSISDEIIFHPVKYKVLFGNKADPMLQATFKLVKTQSAVVNDQDLKARVIDSINQFFSLENWDFGETFYWSELSAYIMKQLAPDLASVVIVPNSVSDTFGSLFEMRAENDEIFISGATVNNVEIITAITAEKLKAAGNVVTSTETQSQTVTSTADTVISTTSTSTSSGGSSY